MLNHKMAPIMTPNSFPNKIVTISVKSNFVSVICGLSSISNKADSSLLSFFAFM